MKKILIAVGLILSFAFISIYTGARMIKIEPKLSDEYMNDTDLLEKSSLVVEVEVGDMTKRIDYSDVQFQLSEVNVLSVLNNPNFEVDNELNILETIFNNDSYPLLAAGGKYILFLDFYDGPVTSEKCFVVSGTNLGSIVYENNSEEFNERQLEGFNYLVDEMNRDITKNLYEQIVEYYNPH